MGCSSWAPSSPTGQDRPLLTCAKLHVHEIIKEDGQTPRQERVGHALPLQVLRAEGDLNSARRAGPDSLLPGPRLSQHPSSLFRARKEPQDEFLTQFFSLQLGLSAHVSPNSVGAPFQPAFFPHLVSGIFGVHSYGHISQHCLDPCCCHHHLLIALWGDRRPCDLRACPFPPHPPAQDPGAAGSYLSLGPCRQRR